MEFIRRVIFKPYLKGMGPTFALTLWDLNERDCLGKQKFAYRLNMGKKTIFQGGDFACSPMYPIDSDSCVSSLMGFLTCKPGDTDDCYFETYSQEQLDFCDQHAESLSCEVYNRFGED